MRVVNRELNDAYEALRRCTDLASALACLKDIGQAIGTPHPAVIDDYSASRLLTVEDGRTLTAVLGWDPEFVEQWFEQRLHLVSPIAAACRITMRPFCWDAQTVMDAVVENSGDPKSWPLNPENGFYGGITVPVHMPRGRTGSVSWYSRDPTLDLEAVLAEHGDVLHGAAHRLMEMVYGIRAEDDSIADGSNRLTDRELECLTWAALGRTDVEVGTLIHRSPATVRFHIDNAVRKLGARNRTQAVAIAALEGLIHPLPSDAEEGRGPRRGPESA